MNLTLRLSPFNYKYAKTFQDESLDQTRACSGAPYGYRPDQGPVQESENGEKHDRPATICGWPYECSQDEKPWYASEYLEDETSMMSAECTKPAVQNFG